MIALSHRYTVSLHVEDVSSRNGGDVIQYAVWKKETEDV